MPALVVFQRPWRIGSDDLVIPGIIEVTLRTAWLGLVVGVMVQHEVDTSRCTSGSYLLRMYLIGAAILLAATVIITVVLLCHSGRGTIMETTPRKLVPHLLVLRVLLGVPEVVWNVLGTVWITTGRIQCQPDSPLPFLMKAVVLYTWVAIFLIVAGVLLLFDPMKRPGMVDAGTLGPNYIQQWEKRCRTLCCVRSLDENSSEAFRNVADVFASLFESSDLVASDVAAALVLLRLQRRAEEEREETFRRNYLHLPISRASTASIGALQDEGSLPHQQFPRPEWMKVGSAHHFMKFALASYGWPWFVYGHVCSSSCSLWPYLTYCSCCRNVGGEVEEDNCCQCHTAAVKAITGMSRESFTFITFRNSIYEAPFFVALDDESENIVVAIRGTLSLHDAITDLNAVSTVVEGEGVPGGWVAHKGVVETAHSVRRRLELTRALPEALDARPGYGIVITGHSLGAGAAVVLAALLRPQYPALKCFAFSPPGGLCSKEFALATQRFVMTVVVGDDLVPRLSMNSIHDLKHKITCILHTCPQPKYRVLARGCWYLLFGISSADDSSASIDSPAINRPLLQGSMNSCTYPQGPFYGNPAASRKSATATGRTHRSCREESVEDVRVNFVDGIGCSSLPPRHTETPLLLPGRILYCFPSLPIEDRLDGSVGEWECTWCETREFSSILISPFMMRHHLPQAVLAALGEAAAQDADP